MLTLVSMSCTLTTRSLKHGPRDEGCPRCHLSFGHRSWHVMPSLQEEMSQVMFYWEKTQVLTIEEEWELFPGPLDSPSNTFLLICIERWISIAHNKIPGTETEPTSLAFHQSFMPSRCNLSRESSTGPHVKRSLQEQKAEAKGSLQQSFSLLTIFLKHIFNVWRIPLMEERKIPTLFFSLKTRDWYERRETNWGSLCILRAEFIFIFSANRGKVIL